MIETTIDKLKFVKHKLANSYMLPKCISIYSDKDGELTARYRFRILNNYAAFRAGFRVLGVYDEVDLYPYELCLFDYRSYINVYYNDIVNKCSDL